MEDNSATKIEEEDKSTENPAASESHADTDSHWDLDILGDGPAKLMNCPRARGVTSVSVLLPLL